MGDGPSKAAGVEGFSRIFFLTSYFILLRIIVLFFLYYIVLISTHEHLASIYLLQYNYRI